MGHYDDIRAQEYAESLGKITETEKGKLRDLLLTREGDFVCYDDNSDHARWIMVAKECDDLKITGISFKVNKIEFKKKKNEKL